MHEEKLSSIMEDKGTEEAQTPKGIFH